VFDDVVVSTESEEVAEVARKYGARVPFLRPSELAGDVSPDVAWIDHLLRTLRASGREYDAFSILRPTNPFRRPETIGRAWQEFVAESEADSLRAVEKCKQHPGKMWVVRGRRMSPLLPLQPSEHPWHSTPYQALPEVYVQTAALEIAWTRVLWETGTIAGNVVMPFFMNATESVDINYPEDWQRCEALAAAGEALPAISQPNPIG
jgi:N-acylneuraminate cytidylyltransferase